MRRIFEPFHTHTNYYERHMNSTTIRFTASLISILLAFNINAQVKFVNEFLNIGVGAKAHGMFGSVVATVDDGTAGYWNTAGLTQIQNPLEINAMHANWFGGLANYDYLSITKKLSGKRPAAAGISVIRMGVDNIPNTLSLIGPDGNVDVNQVTEFSASDLAILLSYAQALNSSGNFSIGGNIKIINRRIGSFATAWGFGADLSAQWRGKHFSYGVSARDITTTWNTWTFTLTEQEKAVFRDTDNEIPISSTESTIPRVIIGAAYHGSRNNISYVAEADLNISTNGTKAGVFSGENISIDPSFGVELGYANKVFVRAGLGNIQSVLNPENTANTSFEFQPNVGLGVSLGKVQVDYALTNIGSVSGVLVSHIFSLKLAFTARQRVQEAQKVDEL